MLPRVFNCLIFQRELLLTQNDMLFIISIILCFLWSRNGNDLLDTLAELVKKSKLALVLTALLTKVFVHTSTNTLPSQPPHLSLQCRYFASEILKFINIVEVVLADNDGWI